MKRKRERERVNAAATVPTMRPIRRRGLLAWIGQHIFLRLRKRTYLEPDVVLVGLSECLEVELPERA
jgi:hypothetical protein